MKVVVTGASGFLGREVSRKLINEGYDVVGWGRRKQVFDEKPLPKLKYESIDLLDVSAMNQSMKGLHSIVHCAALSSVWGKYQDFYRSNVLGTENIAKLGLEHQVERFVNVSSPSIYFEMKDRFLIKESDTLPPKPVNFYAATKRLAENVVDQGVSRGLQAITLRPQAIFGPNDPAIIPRLIRSNASSGIPLPRSKKVIFDITYVENVADACVLALKAPNSFVGSKYNITNDEPIELRSFLQSLFLKLNMPFRERHVAYELLRGIATVLEFSHKVFLPEVEPRLTHYSLGVLNFSRTLDISAARRDLRYAPNLSIEQGVERFVEWWNFQQKSLRG